MKRENDRTRYTVFVWFDKLYGIQHGMDSTTTNYTISLFFCLFVLGVCLVSLYRKTRLVMGGLQAESVVIMPSVAEVEDRGGSIALA